MENVIKFKRQSKWKIYVTKDFLLLSKDKISNNAKLMYCILKSFCGSDLTAFPSQQLLSKQLGWNIETVRKTLTELKNLRLLYYEQRKKNGQWSVNVYELEDEEYWLNAHSQETE